MSSNLENDDININLRKIYKIIQHRKYWIILCFTFIIAFTVFFTLISPKYYNSEVKILINKSSSTNLSDINPFTVSESRNSNGKLSEMIDDSSGSGSNMSTELEILKSSLVLDRVIRENGLKYKTGIKKGKYLSAEDFLKKNFTIENAKNTNIIRISYKSKDRFICYNLINSILNSYKTVYEQINSKKASQDKSFLEKSYISAQNSVNKKVQQLKESNFQNNALSQSSGGLSQILLGEYDKRIKSSLEAASQTELDSKKSQSELDIELDKLKMLKQKYEWSILVENMSKNATNLVILKQPRLPESYEIKGQQLPLNMLIAAIAAFISSCLIVLFLENTDKKITFSVLDDNGIILDNPKYLDISEIIANITLTNAIHIGIVSLADQRFTEEFSNLLNQSLHNASLKFSLTTANSPIDEHILNIKSSEYLIFLTQLNYTEKQKYTKLNKISQRLNKDFLTYLAVFKPSEIQDKICSNKEKTSVNK